MAHDSDSRVSRDSQSSIQNSQSLWSFFCLPCCTRMRPLPAICHNLRGSDQQHNSTKPLRPLQRQACCSPPPRTKLVRVLEIIRASHSFLPSLPSLDAIGTNLFNPSLGTDVRTFPGYQIFHALVPITQRPSWIWNVASLMWIDGD